MMDLFACRMMLLGVLGAVLLVLPADAQLDSGTLEGGGGLHGKEEGGLHKSSGLQSGRLQRVSLKPSSLKTSKLETSGSKRGAKRLNPAAIKLKATELAEGELGIEDIQGAVSSIPRTQVGELLFDVAGVLSLMGEDLSEVAVGYYMAVLADPEGKRHDDALKQLRSIFLDHELEHDMAVRLYDGGLETMKGLVEIKIGLTEGGYRAGLLTLQEVKAAYQVRRKQEISAETAEP